MTKSALVRCSFVDTDNSLPRMPSSIDRVCELSVPMITARLRRTRGQSTVVDRPRSRPATAVSAQLLRAHPATHSRTPNPYKVKG